MQEKLTKIASLICYEFCGEAEAEILCCYRLLIQHNEVLGLSHNSL